MRFNNGSFLQSYQKDAANIKKKMQNLRNGIALGATARFNRPMVYRALRPLARFHDDYRAVDEIVLNSQTLEASSRVSFGGVKRGGNFHTHPAIIDSLTHACGFTMNCNDSNDLDVEVFMNHGWGSFQIFEPLDLEKEYTTYTRMVEGVDKLWHGDAVVFDGERVVAYFGQFAVRSFPSPLHDRRMDSHCCLDARRTAPSLEGHSSDRKRDQLTETTASAEGTGFVS